MAKAVLKVKGMQWAAQSTAFRFGNPWFPTLALPACAGGLAAFLHGKTRVFPTPFHRTVQWSALNNLKYHG